MASLPCSHFFVALLVHLRQVHPLVCVVALLVHLRQVHSLVCVVALLVHLRQVHPLCVCYCFVGALETSAPPDAYSTSNLPLWSTTYLLPVPPTRTLALNWCVVASISMLLPLGRVARSASVSPSTSRDRKSTRLNSSHH